MRLLGVLVLAAAGAALGAGKAAELARTVKRREEFCWFLERLRSELEGLQSPLPELFSSLAAACAGEGGRLCAAVCRGFSASDGRLFSEIWSAALGGVSRRERELLMPLGTVLGRGPVDTQLPVIGLCRREMELALREARTRRQDVGRVYIGLGAAGGLVLAVLLV